MSNQKQGFTLVELAIVIVIIGLLVAGVLQGKELIEASRRHSIWKEYQEYLSAIVIYKGNNNFYPGDNPIATKKYPSTLNGNGDGNISWGQNEGLAAWEHLSLERLYKARPAQIGGTIFYAATTSAMNKAFWRFQSKIDGWTSLPYTNSLQLSSINAAGNDFNGKFIEFDSALAIDEKFDNGLATSGKIIASCATGYNYNSGTCLMFFDVN